MQVFIVEDFELLLPPFSRVASPEDPAWSQPCLGPAYRALRGLVISLGQRGRADCGSDPFPGVLRSVLTLFHGLSIPFPFLL